MTTTYERRILGDPDVSRGLSDPLDGFAQVDEVVVELSNEDGYFNGRDLRGELLNLRRFDRYSAELLTEITGRVMGQSLLPDRISLRMASQDLDELQTVIPRLTVTSTLFAQAHQSALGQPIPIVFGNIKKLELAFVSDDIVLNRYDYLLGDSAVVSAATAIYRDTVGGTLGLVPPSEYTTVVVGSYRLIRFTKRQISFGGGLHTIYADLTGLSAQRNFAKAIQYILQTILGLSISVSSFTVEASKLDAIGGLLCDGVILEQQPAMDYLRQLCQVRGIRLSKNVAGEWTITVDTQESTIHVTFGIGPDQPWRNVQSLDGVENAPLSEAIKTLYLDYRKEWRSREYRLSVSRSVLSSGREERIQNDFISDSTTADKTVDYIGKRKFYEDNRIRFTAGQEGRRLTELQLFRFDSPTLLGISNKTYRTVSVRRSISSVGIVGVAWDPNIYVYSVGTIPPEPSTDTDTELANTTPTAVSVLILQSSGVVETLDGGFEAFMVLQYTVPVETFAQTIVRFRRNGTTSWQTVAVNGETGSAKQTRINGLVTGIPYDFRVSRVNLLNASLEATTDLLNQLTPGDTTAPAAPGTPSTLDQHLKTITFTWAAPADKDVREYEFDIRTAANGGGTFVTSRKSGGPKTTLTLNQIPYGSARHFRVRAIDFTGNIGAYSSSVSFTFSKIVTGDIGGGTVGGTELGNGSVSTAKLIAQAVTTAIRQLMNSQSFGYSIGPNGTVNISVVIGFSVRPSVTLSTGIPLVAGWISYRSANDFTVSLYNLTASPVNATCIVDYW